MAETTEVTAPSSAKRDQVAEQCKVVAHLAEALAKVHKDYELLIRSGAVEGLLDKVGERTASIMEELGDILNEMDACSVDDEWTHAVFDKVRHFSFGKSSAA